jgi:hypothetical protein
MNPKLPSRIGKITKREDIFGNPMIYEVLDEIIYIPPSNPGKAIYLQKLQFEPDKTIELRLCYYMIGQKGNRKGKWLYGQFAAMVRPEDLEYILLQAREKGWIS